MGPKYAGGAYCPMYLPRWHYFGGETLTMDGSAQQLNIPDGATIVEILAETADIYFSLNHVVANANSPGYVPASGGELLGPLSNLIGVSLWGAAADGGIAHVMYFREH